MIEREENRAAKCSCNHGWVCEEHPDQPWDHDDRGGAGELCENPNCTKDPDTIFAAVHLCSQNA